MDARRGALADLNLHRELAGGREDEDDGPWRGSTREASTLRKPGTRKPKVLPEPVLATPITSRFAIAAGHVCAWMTEGVEAGLRDRAHDRTGRAVA